MKIENYQLITDAGVIDLPKLAQDSIVRVWEVPTEYRENGLFVTADPTEIPACDHGAPVFEHPLPAHPDAVLALAKAAMVKVVDDLIAGIYAKWMRFEAEYREREAAARQFRDAGYSGDPGVWVAAFANSAGKPLGQAADLIIAQADQLREALQQLGALRMTKYGILAAPDVAAAQAKRDEIVNQANAIAATLS